MNLTSYRTLGRSGLIVSPLALGAMTFGTSGWGSVDEVSKAIFHAYIEAGGNFIDTAEAYSDGKSEELIGSYIANGNLRDRLVLATKYTWNNQAGNPLAGGNGRKNIHRALEGSLRRLRTDYIDLYWMHAWDMITPVEEVVQSLGDLVKAGKIRYFGFSNTPAWYAAKAATLATAHNMPNPIAIQDEYSLVARQIEREHVAAARDCGLGIVPWSPLAAGFLAGKYERKNEEVTGEGRLIGPNPFGNSKFTDRNWQILDTLRDVAAEVNRPMAQVALAWALAQPAIASLLLGASKLTQLHDNLASLEIQLTPEQLQTLDTASIPDSMPPYAMISRMIFEGNTVQDWR